MKSIKTISGKTLLYFYFLQRSNYSSLHDQTLDFQMRNFSGRVDKSPKLLSKENLIIKNLLKITGSDNNLYNAIKYLEDKGFIEMKYSPDKTCDNFTQLRVVSGGVDVVEAIERGKEEKQEFYTTFNIQLTDKTNIESLLEGQLGSLYEETIM